MNPLNLEFHDRDGYLFIKASLDWTEATARSLIDQVHQEVSRRGFTRIFADLRGSTLDSELTKFFGAEYLAEVMGSRFQIAVLDDPWMVNGFAENVAVNRGARYRAFTSEQAALEWLLK